MCKMLPKRILWAFSTFAAPFLRYVQVKLWTECQSKTFSGTCPFLSVPVWTRTNDTHCAYYTYQWYALRGTTCTFPDHRLHWSDASPMPENHKSTHHGIKGDWQSQIQLQFCNNTFSALLVPIQKTLSLGKQSKWNNMCLWVSQIESTKYRVTSLSFTDEGMWSNQNSENQLELRTIICQPLLFTNSC